MSEQAYPHVAEIIEMIHDLEYLQYFPKTEKGIFGYAKGVHRIIQDQIHFTALESCRILIDKAMDTCDKLPDMPTLDELYRKCGFRPKDLGPIPEWMRKAE